MNVCRNGTRIARYFLANVRGQVSPLAFGMISCASRRHDKSAEGMGISCTGPLNEAAGAAGDGLGAGSEGGMGGGFEVQ